MSSLLAVATRRLPARGRRRSAAPLDGPGPWGRRGAAARAAVRRLGVRPFGWGVLVAALVALVVGMSLGWWEFTVAGVAGVALFAFACLFMIGHPSYAVALELPQRRVVVGRPASGQLTATSTAARRLLGTRMELPVGERVTAFPLPALAPGASHVEPFTIPTRRRGVVVVGPVRSVQGDPFGITGRERRWSDPVDVFVHPETVSLPGRQAGFVHDLEGHPTAHLAASDMSFHALRTYVPGDDPRHVHWRSSARTGQLMVRQFEETRQSRVAVAVDVARESYVSEDEFETAISAAGSCALQAVREENPLTLLTSRAVLPSVSAARTLDELCRVEWSTKVRAHELTTQVLEQAAGAAVIIVVTGSGLPLARLRQSCATFDVDARVLGIRVAEGAQPSVRASANVSILTIAALDELPRLVRRALT